MDVLVADLLALLDWLLRTTWQAGVLVCLILLVQKAAGRWLGVRGRYALWFVLLVRLALPWAPPSSVSVYNLLPRSSLPGYERSVTRDSGNVGDPSAATDGISAGTTPGPAAATGDNRRRTESTSQRTSPGRYWPGHRATGFLAMVWLAGACLLGGHIAESNVRWWRVVRRGRPVADPKILGLLG